MPNLRRVLLPLIVTAGIVALAATHTSAPSHNPVLELFAPPKLKLSPAELDSADTSAGLARMIALLETSNRPVPRYLRLVGDEYGPKPRQTATFAVGCYWEGERDLGKLDGVLASRTGVIGRDEIVEVEYDPTLVSYPELVDKAKRLSCFRKVYARDTLQEREATALHAGAITRSNEPVDTTTQQQFHLSMHPEYHYLPLTALQATKINAALFAHEDPEQFLSPAQKTLKDRIARVLARRRRAIDRFDGLTPRRDRAGLPDYCRTLQSRLVSLGA
jgi:hypothetical protein